MRWTFVSITLLSAGLLSTPAQASDFETIAIQRGLIRNPVPSAFTVCFRHTCEETATVSLNPDQWAGVQRSFNPAPRNAVEERQRIGDAIAYLERVVGAIIGTSGDLSGNLAGLGADTPQQDCVDESTNSTTYMLMMQNDGLLKFHQLDNTSTRGFIVFGWPHTTAVIRERASGARWAVDSWFRNNGELPDIIPLAQWKDGWEPEGFSGF